MTEEREFSVDGVTVQKWIDTDDFPVPAVSFELTSEREEAVVVRLVDTIPESFSMERVGFHPEYESENWTAYPDQRVGFERELEPGESVRTVYGVRIEDEAETDQFGGEPEVEVLAPADAAAADDEEGLGEATMSDIAPPERTEVVRDVIQGERDTVPGLDDGEEAESPEDILEDLGEPIDEDAPSPAAEAGGDGERVGEDDSGPGEPDDAEEPAEGTPSETDPLAEDAGEDPLVEDPEETESPEEEEPPEEPEPAEETEPVEGAEPAEEDAPAAGASAGDDAAASETPGASPGNVAAALAAEIEAGNVDDETLATLRGALGGVPNSVDTRLSHLQSRVSDMEAYADAIEEFIDESGTGRQRLDDLEAEIAAVDDRTEELADEVREDVAERMENAREHRQSLADDIESLEADLDEEVALLDEDIESLEADLADLEDQLEDARDDLEGELADVEDDVAALREDIEEFRAWRDQLSSAFGGVGGSDDE